MSNGLCVSCAKPIGMGVWCEMCGGHVCKACQTTAPEGLVRFYCKRCWELGEPHRQTLSEAEDACEAAWREACDMAKEHDAKESKP